MAISTYQRCKENKKIWVLKKVKTIQPIMELSVCDLAKITPIKFIKLTEDEIIASSEVGGTIIKNPITKPFHPTAIGIHLIYDFQLKTLEFFELNSAVKGWGEKMVYAALKNLPHGWKVNLVFDWSGGFWDKMQRKYRQMEWVRI